MKRYYTNCVSWPPSDVDDGLIPMINEAETIDRSEFLAEVSLEDMANMEHTLGYDTTLPLTEAVRREGELKMGDDWAVSYHRSQLHGKPVVYFRWSAIEYVFTENGHGFEI